MRIYWLLMFLMINTANALLVEDLYNAEIKVPSKSISLEQRNILIKQEFVKVLEKITGKPKSLSIEDVDKYVSKYEYMDTVVNQLKDDEQPNNKTILKIYFDKKLINKALAENGHMFLDEHRPLTIIWPKSFTAATFSPEQELLQQIIVLAKKRGLPIILPMFDLKEVEILHADPLDAKLTDSIKQASKKYSADEVIIVECNTKDDVLHISWKSIINDWQFNDQLADINNIDNQNVETKSINFAIQANLFIDKLMEHFVHHYTVGNNSAIAKEVVLMKISNVINLEDYVQVEKYLQNLAVVNTFQATKFQAGEVEFSIVATGGKQAIKNAVSTNKLLQEEHNNNHDDNTLIYTLQLS